MASVARGQERGSALFAFLYDVRDVESVSQVVCGGLCVESKRQDDGCLVSVAAAMYKLSVVYGSLFTVAL